MVRCINSFAVVGKPVELHMLLKAAGMQLVCSRLKNSMVVGHLNLSLCTHCTSCSLTVSFCSCYMLLVFDLLWGYAGVTKLARSCCLGRHRRM